MAVPFYFSIFLSKRSCLILYMFLHKSQHRLCLPLFFPCEDQIFMLNLRLLGSYVLGSCSRLSGRAYAKSVNQGI